MDEGILYVSMEYATAAHKCCCGCGNDVFTRLSPSDWKLTFDGRTVSLFPSVGNWDFSCQSHYWIKNNRVVWDAKWSRARIDALKQGVPFEERTEGPRRGIRQIVRKWLRRDASSE
jgi:hypothetical protein